MEIVQVQMRCGIVARLAFALLALLLSWSPTLAQAQSQARVTSRLSSGVVKLGSEVTLIATVENASFSDVRALPTVEGLRLGPWGTPSSRSSTAYANGRVTRSDERTWTAAVRPLRKGEFSIPGIELTVDGALVRTQPLTLNVVEDLKGEELGSFEIRASSMRVVEGQPFSVELIFGWDQALTDRINWANLSLSWWGQLSGAIENDPPPTAPGANIVEIVLNSTETVRVEQLQPMQIRGRPFRMFRLVRSFTPTRAGVLEFPSSWLEFARIVDAGDIFSRRRERVESFFVRSEALNITVIELPENGRPADFGGAIGNFSVRASAEPRDVDAGESIKLKVEWSGSGNLEFFSAPEPSRSDAFAGFRVYGKTESKSLDRRTITYDIAPKSAQVKQIPALVLPVFDPVAGRYTSVATDPIAINVRGLARASGLGEVDGGFVAQPDLADLASQLGGSSDLPRPGARSVFFTLGALPLLWLGLLRVTRRRADPWAPLERRRRRARRELARELEHAASARDELLALQKFLAARTAERPEAWQGRDLNAWFAEQCPDVPRELVLELEQLVLGLEASVWGGVNASNGRKSAMELAQRLEGAGL
jgi:hypothetical protein